MEDLDDRMKRKKTREDMAGNALKEKGKDMNLAEKAFVGNFAKKDCGFEKEMKK